MKLRSYWLDTAEPAGDFRRRELPPRADVAVIGAGLTGLSTALHLARAGADVVLLESHTVGWGASGRNGGMATTGLAISYPKAVKRYGNYEAARMYTAYNDAIDTVEKVVRDEGIDCDFARTGKLTLQAVALRALRGVCTVAAAGPRVLRRPRAPLADPLRGGQ